MNPTVPPPRLPLPGGGSAQWASWYEEELGWATVSAPGEPVLLCTGLRFDVLELPADAGRAVLRRVGPTGPVALQGELMRLLVAAGSAEEVPALLEWLEWGSVPLDLRAIGPGSLITAPAPPLAAPCGPSLAGGAAVWLRPPAPVNGRELPLPVFTGFGGAGREGRGAAPDLVRLLAAAATECHRARLIVNTALSKERQTQPLAFS
ncbi:SCO3374 family protein [Streptomyces sp. NPDC058657]|uniref:SCO3374 family protein n=1 Tax=unclassified Streptomyces TaxID=2593676 RepID=UPI0036516F7E